MDEVKRGLRDLKRGIEQAAAEARTSGEATDLNVAGRRNIAVAGNVGGDGSHAVSTRQVSRIRQRDGETVEETKETVETRRAIERSE